MKNQLLLTGLFVASLSTMAQIPNATYLFDGNGKDAVDTNHLLLNNVTFSTDMEGVANKTAEFNGANSWAKIPAKIFPSKPYELRFSLWFKTKNNQKGGGLVFAGSETVGNYVSNYTPVLYIDTFGKLNTFIYDGGVTPIKSAVSVNDNKWHHAMVVYSINPGNGALGQFLYLDGTNVAGKAGTIGGTPSFTNMYIGACYPRGIGAVPQRWLYFDGYIDEVNIYNKVLSNEVWENFMFKLTSIPANQNVKYGDSAVFSITHTDFHNLTGYKYVWKKGADSVGNSKNFKIPSTMAGNQGNYTCEVSNLYGKKLISQVAVLSFKFNAGVSNSKLNNKALVYPNPVSDYITVSSNVSNQINVLDVNGKLLLTGATNELISIQELPVGIYIVQLKEGGKTLSSKIIKQ